MSRKVSILSVWAFHFLFFFSGQDDIHKKLSFLENCLVPKGRFLSASAEKATANFHCTVTEQIRPLMDTFGLSSGDTFLLCLEVFERLKKVNYSKPEATPVVHRPVSTEEKDILHYIGGSIINSLKNSLTLNEEQEGQIAVVDSLATKKAPKDIGFERSMTSLLDRGGLTYIKPGMAGCMAHLEEQFREMHWGNREDFQTRCLNNAVLISEYYTATYSCLASEDDKEYILLRILKLFYKIRIHHKCKMLIDNYRFQRQVSSKKKGIRKQLKTQHSTE